MSFLPKSIKDTFNNLTQETEDHLVRFANYVIYKAIHANNGRTYTILLFNHNSEMFEINRDLALAHYMQEMFSLCARLGEYDGMNQLMPSNLADENEKKAPDHLDAPFLDFKDFAIEGDKVALVMKNAQSLKELMAKQQESQVNAIDVVKMIQDVYFSVKYIKTRFGVEKIDLRPETIYSIMKMENGIQKAEYFPMYWLAGAQSANIQQDEKTSTKKYYPPQMIDDASLQQDDAVTLYMLGLLSLEILGIEQEIWQTLQNVIAQKVYDFTLNGIIHTLTEKLEQQQAHSVKKEQASTVNEIVGMISATLQRDPLERIQTFTRLLSSMRARKDQMHQREGEEEEKKKVAPKNHHEELKVTDDFVINERELSEEVKKVVEWAEPWQVEEIRLTNKPLTFMDEMAIGKNSTWTNLLVLELNNTQLGDRGTVLIGSNTTWKKLKKLVLCNNNIGEEGGEAIGRDTTWSDLEKFWLENNQLKYKGVAVLGGNITWEKLKMLALSNNNIGDSGIAAIARNTTWRGLEELWLNKNEIGDKGAVAIASNTTWVNLKRLILTDNMIGDEGEEAIARNETLCQLEELWIARNQIADKGAVAISSNPVWTNLTLLNLQNNKINGKGDEAIGTNTTWINIEFLYLDGNEIGDKGASEIGGNTVWKNLRKIGLGVNKIGDEGSAAIGRISTWTNLEALWLYGNQIGDKGASVIGSNTLERI